MRWEARRRRRQREMSGSPLSLVVLRSYQMDASHAFYQSLGLEFVEEKHGTGPVHYSAQAGSTVLEIYPGEAAEPLNRTSSGAMMLGFGVESLDSIVAALQKLGCPMVTPPRDSTWGRRAVF